MIASALALALAAQVEIEHKATLFQDQFTHPDPFADIALSPDGLKLAALDREGQILVFQLGEKKPALTIAPAAKNDHLTFCWGSNETIVTAGLEIVRVYSCNNGHLEREIRYQDACDLIAPPLLRGVDANRVVVYGIRSLAMLDPSEGKVVWSEDPSASDWRHAYRATSLLTIPKKSLLFTARSEIIVRDLEKGEISRLLNGDDADIEALESSVDGDILIAGDSKGRVRLWKTDDWESLGSLEWPGSGKPASIVGLHLKDASSVIAAYSNGLLIDWDLASRKPKSTFDSHISSVVAAAFLPARRTIFLAQSVQPTCGRFTITSSAYRILSVGWDPELRLLSPAHLGQIARITISPAGTAASESGDAISVLDWKKSELLRFIPKQRWGLSLSTVSHDGRSVYHVRDGNLLSLPIGTSGEASTIARGEDWDDFVTTDGGSAVVRKAGRVLRRKLSEGDSQLVFESQDELSCAAIGKETAAVVGVEGDTELIDLKTGKRVFRIAPSYQARYVAISDDAEYIMLTGRLDEVVIVQRSCSTIQRVPVRHACGPAVFLRGKPIAISAEEGEIVLFDCSAGKVLRRVNSESGNITALASADSVLMTAGEDKTLRFWQVRIDK